VAYVGVAMLRANKTLTVECMEEVIALALGYL
jgi:hypothetical protein